MEADRGVHQSGEEAGLVQADVAESIDLEGGSILGSVTREVGSWHIHEAEVLGVVLGKYGVNVGNLADIGCGEVAEVARIRVEGLKDALIVGVVVDQIWRRESSGGDIGNNRGIRVAPNESERGVGDGNVGVVALDDGGSVAVGSGERSVEDL